jgi:hypothetical protein
MEEELPPSVVQALKANPGCAISVAESTSYRVPAAPAPATSSTTREYFLLCPHRDSQLLERSTSQRELQAHEAVPGLGQGPLGEWLGRGAALGHGGGGGDRLGGAQGLEGLLPPPWAAPQSQGAAAGLEGLLPPWAQQPQSLEGLLPPWAALQPRRQQQQQQPPPSQHTPLPRRPPAPGSIQV